MSGGQLSGRSVVVLKFGGSVLHDESDVHVAVHEIYRWVRRGDRVVAVVSALEGTTDALIARARAYGHTPHEGAYATLLATGEETSAALLGLAIDRAGVPVEVLDAAAVDLRTTGTTLDAFPESIDAPGVLRALERTPVLVIPGFIGRNADGRTTLLGRGGSDLTALFVAERLIAAGATDVRCRLVKDVDGLYEFDPADTSTATRPARYAALHWDGALALDGGIVQHKAVRYAKGKGLPFEVGAALAEDVTLVGDFQTRTAERLVSTDRPRIRVALLGCGTVGLGVYERLLGLGDRFEVVRIAVRDIKKAAASGVEPRLLTTHPFEAAACDCELVIETMGGIDPARSAIERALRDGKGVVTANKAVIAAHGDELRAIAEAHGATLRSSASVGGAMHAIETVARAVSLGQIVEITGVLNGTTNFVLGRITGGDTLAAAVSTAQDAGFAESDPSRDLDGRDAGDKLCVLAQEAWGGPSTSCGPVLEPGAIEREPLTDESIARSTHGLARGETIRHIARVRRDSNGTLRATVTLERVPVCSAFGAATQEWNALLVRLSDGSSEACVGRGAGRWPTTESVLADVLATAHPCRSRSLIPM